VCHRDPNKTYRNKVMPITLVKRLNNSLVLTEASVSHGDASGSRTSGEGSNTPNLEWLCRSGPLSRECCCKLGENPRCGCGWCSDPPGKGCNVFFCSSSPSLGGSAEVGGVELVVDGFEDDGHEDEDEDADAGADMESVLVRKGDGGDLYVCRYPG